jgi:L-arabinose isomerase
MERHLRVQPKIGYFGSGLAAYWPQFPELKPHVLTTMERHTEKLEAMGCWVVRGGLVDRAELSSSVGDLFAREQVDLIIGEIMTYTASHVLIPIAQRNIAPYLTLALQLVPTVDYEHVGTEQTTMIGAAMTAPEVSCAFNRCGLPFHCVVGGDFQEKVWIKVQEWIEAAAVKRALSDSRLGYLGH